MSAGGMDRVGSLALLVEDEEHLLFTCKLLLDLLGYRALAALDAGSAINLYAARKEEISFAIMDVSLAGKSGFDLHREMEEIRPIPTIFMSGALRREDLERYPVGRKITFLRKPFGREEFAEAINNLMKEEAS